ncbi:MAG: hypothetical protein EOO63_02980 [Hymenobacter sp.]|nr:MAG: hypothetical protein EOO63_02980 [Hymenobacter sp.]
MPKLIDYPRTSYPGAWEIAEVVDDTGGKCALETCARKLNRKVSGSFKAIVGSAVKFGLLTSKRELLTTTTLFRRIKHAYDKQEELLFHREAFLTPPLFTQLCRKFRSRELPVAMLDVLLIREFGVEEINAQGVAKAFVDGARMVGLLDEHDIVADIDQLAAQQPVRRELASPSPSPNVFRQPVAPNAPEEEDVASTSPEESPEIPARLPVATPARAKTSTSLPLPPSRPAPAATSDAIANLFGLGANSILSTDSVSTDSAGSRSPAAGSPTPPIAQSSTPAPAETEATKPIAIPAAAENLLFQLQLAGPGINTTLDVTDADDLLLIRALLDKIERQLKRGS